MRIETQTLYKDMRDEKIHDVRYECDDIIVTRDEDDAKHEISREEFNCYFRAEATVTHTCAQCSREWDTSLGTQIWRFDNRDFCSLPCADEYAKEKMRR